MKELTVRQRIIGSLGVILALMLVMGAIAFNQLLVINNEVNKMQSDSLPGLYQSGQLLSLYEANYSLTSKHVYEMNASAASQLAADIKRNAADAARLNDEYGAAIFGAKDRETFDAFKSALRSYESTQSDVLNMSSDSTTKQAASAALRTRLQPLFERLQSALNVMVDFNKRNAENSAAQIQGSVRTAQERMLESFIVALLLAALCGYFLLRSITVTLRYVAGVADEIGSGNLAVRVSTSSGNDEIGLLTRSFDKMVSSLSGLIGDVQTSGVQVSSSMTEIAATAKEQQATASETAATVSEIGATSREIAATSRELVKTMGEVSAVAEQTATVAGAGQAGLSQMEETMHSVMEAGKSINEKLAILNEKAGNINQVVTTITKVADQTNLLSLNAAIEAEKAGEYGRGFAVVATEIRRLADQTAVATFDIEEMVKEIQSAVSAGVMGMDKFADQVRRGMHDVQEIGGQFSQIIQQIQALAPRMESVNEGMQAQSAGADQITQALTQLTEAAQQTVESLRQSSTAIDDLNHVSLKLRDGVSGFTLVS